jgi:predicted P-loop ATPase
MTVHDADAEILGAFDAAHDDARKRRTQEENQRSKPNGHANGHDDDPSVEQPAEAGRTCPPAVHSENTFARAVRWQEPLLCNSKGEVMACLANAITALRTAPEWEDRIWFDAFHNRAVLRGKPPWSNRSFDDEPWSDLFDNLVTNWMNHHGITASRTLVGQAVWTVAHDQWFHPVRQYLESCRRKWDEDKRVEKWASTYLGTPKTTYSCAVAPRWLLSLIARVMEPGCKADSSLVLEGLHGMLKSEALRRLGYPWFTDDMGGSTPGTKDSAIQLAGVWVVELAELDQFTTGRDVSRTKSFMSRATDRFRPPYGSHSIAQPRQCCFGCTTNKTEYLPDETGNRRWWPIECTKIELEKLTGDKDQIFGEAVALYEQGARWWLDTPELNKLASAEQDFRYVPDSWDSEISRHLNNPSDLVPRSSITVGQILRDVIGLEIDKWGRNEEMRVAKSLRKLGWIRKQQRGGKSRQWRYFRPDGDDQPEQEMEDDDE